VRGEEGIGKTEGMDCARGGGIGKTEQGMTERGMADYYCNLNK
jgi:hypothetical protein